jgi:transcriptional regulator with XRE-family HTH domain
MQASPQFRVRGQSALSRASGVPQPTINRILNNRSDPESENVRKLAGVFGVTFEWLMSERGPKYVVDLSYTDRDGKQVFIEAKPAPLSAASRKTEEVVNTTSQGTGKHVNNTSLEIAQRFAEELLAAVHERRVSDELLATLVNMFHLGTAASVPRGDQHHTKMVRSRGTRKRGVGTG